MQLIELIIGTAAFITMVSKSGQPIVSYGIMYHIRTRSKTCLKFNSIMKLTFLKLFTVKPMAINSQLLHFHFISLFNLSRYLIKIQKNA